MSAGFEKRKKLAYVARRYYLEDRKQSDIARELGVPVEERQDQEELSQ